MARILIADDDPEYLSAFSAGLSTVGHEVIGVGSGKAALERLQAETFDMIFLDVFMEGGGAISLSHAVRDIAPDLPIIVITGKLQMLDSPILRDGLRLANARIGKTVSLSELDNLVKKMARSKGA